MKLRDFPAFFLHNNSSNVASLFTRENSLSFFTANNLEDIDIPISRAAALKIPAVLRARNLICTTVARTPLTIGNENCKWILESRTQSFFQKILNTVDDLLFYGESVWLIEKNTDGNIIDSAHIKYSKWTENHNSDEITLSNGKVVNKDDYIKFFGIHEGLLSHAAETFADAAAINKAASRVGRNPAALIELRQTNDAEMSQEDIQNLISAYTRARRAKNGAVAYTSPGIEVIEHSIAAENLLIDGRNAAAIDCARACGVPAAFIDATVAGTSLSYSNTESRMIELVTFGAEPFMSAIEDRLNAADIQANINFDVKALLETIPHISTGGNINE